MSASDSIELMRSQYGVPADVPVHRAEDDVRVTDTWPELTGLGSLHAAPSTAQTDEDGAVWTGADGSHTCQNWTSGASTDFGSRGFTNRASAVWLFEDSLRCDRMAGLFCVCW